MTETSEHTSDSELIKLAELQNAWQQEGQRSVGGKDYKFFLTQVDGTIIARGDCLHNGELRREYLVNISEFDFSYQSQLLEKLTK